MNQNDDKTDTDSSSSQNNVIFSNTSQNLATGSDKDLGDKPATTDISSDDNGEDTDWDLLLNDINAIVEDCDSEDLDLPVPCSCHNLPLGNCPSNISNTINTCSSFFWSNATIFHTCFPLKNGQKTT